MTAPSSAPTTFVTYFTSTLLQLNSTNPITPSPVSNGKSGDSEWNVTIGGVEVKITYLAIAAYVIISSIVVCILAIFCKKYLRLDRLKDGGLGLDAAQDIELIDRLKKDFKQRSVSNYQQINDTNDNNNNNNNNGELQPNIGIINTHDTTDHLSAEAEDAMLSQLNLSAPNKSGILDAPNHNKKVSTISIRDNLGNNGFDERKINKPPEKDHVYHEKMQMDEYQRQKQKAKAANISIQVIEDDEEETMSFVKRLIYFGRRVTLCTPVFFHFWDMATDLGVLFDWLPHCDWDNFNADESPVDPRTPNTVYFVLASLGSMFLYRFVSGIMYANRFGKCNGFLQFLDIMLFFEVYASMQGTRVKSTVQLRWIRRMESVFESAPQAVIQLIYLLSVSGGSLSPFIQASLVMSVLSVCSSVVKSDEWKFRNDLGCNQMLPPHPRFIARAVFRLCEVLSRLCVIALLTQTIGSLPTFAILGCELVFYFVMYHDKFLGDDIGNVVEVLILHPNLSLRVNPEEHIDPLFGCLLRTIFCWTPIACLYLSYNRFKKIFCPSEHDKEEAKSDDKEESSRFQKLRDVYHKKPIDGNRHDDNGGFCGIFRSCINRNLVTVHFSHRFLEQFAELLLVYGAYNNDLKGFQETLFAVSTFCTILTPCLYLVIGRWVIIGEHGLEMNVFGFLHQAHEVEETNLLVEFVFRVPKCVNYTNEFGRTPLMESLLIHDYGIFSFFCKQRKTDLRIGDPDEKQIIHYVAEDGDFRFLHVLLDQRKKAQHALAMAKKQGDKREKFIRDCDRKIFELDCLWAFKKTPIIICAEKGHWECFKELLEAGAKYNHVDGRGRTCLHYAIFGESKTKNWAADLDNLDMEKQAQHQDFTNMVNTLLDLHDIDKEIADSKRKWTPMLQAVGGGTVEVVKQLVEKGASLDGIDEKGESLLHVAVRYNQADVLQYLLTESGNHKWNLTHKNSDGDTPLKLAVYGKYEQCLRCLAIFESRRSLMKALLLAVKTNAPELITFLLKECQVDPNFNDKDQMTPLRWAAFYGYKQVLKELLINGARDDLDQFGQNIVFYAAKNGHTECLELLRKANADFNVVNYEGKTATDKTEDSRTVKFVDEVRKKQMGQMGY